MHSMSDVNFDDLFIGIKDRLRETISKELDLSFTKYKEVMIILYLLS